MNKLTVYFYLICIAFFLVSCSYFKQTETKQALAKAGDVYLYAEDIPATVLESKTKEDSIAKMNQFINKWALKNLLLKKAKFNLPEEQQQDFDQMAEQYRIQLYINAYKDALIEKNISSSFTEEEILTYYEEKKQNFKLKESLLKLRYLVLKSDLQDVEKIKSKFFDFTEDNQEYLRSKRLEFKMLMLNDSVWVRMADVQKQLPSVQEELSRYVNENELQKSAVFQDSIFTYLVHVSDMLTPNEVPPITYLKPTIQQILENKRKLELNKQLEKDILNDATQNNDFKTY